MVFLLPLFSFAQIGEAIKFDYNGNGHRILRYHDPSAVLSKPGSDVDNPADTVIGYYKKEDPSVAITEADYFVKAYPNPVHDILYVENLSWKDGDIALYRVTDISGKNILSKQTTQAKDQILFGSAIVPGNYHVRYYVNGVFIISWQIVKL